MKPEITRQRQSSPAVTTSQEYYQHKVIETVYPAKIQNLWVYRVRAFDTYPYLKHAIFTRRGGGSLSPFDSLNLSISVGDDPQTVQKNFDNACQAIGITPEQTVSSHLVHGAEVATINGLNRQQIVGQVDSLITREPGVYLFMRFGDCTPLLFFDPVTDAVGLAHAGWRGTIQNVAGATVKAMVDGLGCQAKDIVAVIGPAIGPCCYEVGYEVIDAATSVFDEPKQLFSQYSHNPVQAHFNLWAANRQQLVESGVEHIIQSNLCTACRTDDFFSHRAEKGQTGRFGVVIGVEENDR